MNLRDKKENHDHLLKLKTDFIERLKTSGVEYSINGAIEEAVPHILSVSFPAVRSDMLLIQLDLNGVAVSAGSACSAGSLEASHVLASVYGKDATQVNHTIRFSFGLKNTLEEIEKVIDLIEKFAK